MEPPQYPLQTNKSSVFLRQIQWQNDKKLTYFLLCCPKIPYINYRKEECRVLPKMTKYRLPRLWITLKQKNKSVWEIFSKFPTFPSFPPPFKQKFWANLTKLLPSFSNYLIQTTKSIISDHTIDQEYEHFIVFKKSKSFFWCFLNVLYYKKQWVFFSCHFLRINLNKYRKKNRLWRFYSVTFFTRLQTSFKKGKWNCRLSKSAK